MMKKCCLILLLLCLFTRGYSQPGSGTYFDPYIIDVTGGYCSSSAQFNNDTDAGLAFNNPFCWAGTEDQNDVWFIFYTLSTKPYLIEVKGYGTGGGSLKKPLLLAGGDCSSYVEDSIGLVRTMVTDFPAGVGIIVRVNALNSNVGTFQLCIKEANFPNRPYQDCEDAVLLDLSKSEHCIDTLLGRGDKDDGASCLSTYGERASAWYVWEAANDGKLTFDIVPYLNDDIDFILYEMPEENCESLIELRCEGSQCRDPITNEIITPTGLDSLSTDTVETGGCEEGQDNYLKYVKQEEGKRYAIYINNFSTDHYYQRNGVCLYFGGDAESAPFLLAVYGDKSCSDACDGFAIAAPEGDTGPYTYEWNTGETTQVIYDLCGGTTYICTVTDGLGTKQVDSIALHLPVQIDTGIVYNPVCTGDKSGGIDIEINHEAPGLTYSWSTANGSGLELDEKNQRLLSSGTYDLVVSDSEGCADRETFVLTDPPAIHIILDSTVSPMCFGYDDGEIYITISKGKLPFVYQWSTEEGTGLLEENEDQPGVSAGIYFVTVTDVNNCTATRQIVLADPEQINITEHDVQRPLCPGDTNANIIIEVSGGNPPYTYQWSVDGGKGLIADNKNQTNISAGAYLLSVTDSKTCVSTKVFIIEDPPPLQRESAILVDANCLTHDDGYYEPEITGGTGGYTFIWTTENGEGIAPGESLQEELYPGDYQLIITDENGCELPDSFCIGVYLLDAGTGIDQFLCNLDTFVLDSALVGADPFGRWYDLNNAVNLTDHVLYLADFDSGRYQYKYIIDQNEYCDYSEAFVTIDIEEFRYAGKDTALMVCVENTVDLSTLLRESDGGGQWVDAQNTGCLNGSYFDPVNLKGVFSLHYQVDQDVCPGNKAIITLVTDTVHPEMICSERLEISLFEITKFFTVETEELDPVSIDDDCSYKVFNDLNYQSTLNGARLPNGKNVNWYAVDSANNMAHCVVKVNFDYRIPNLITPNGDGDNEVWYFTISEDYPDAVVRIFNRWGQLVYISQKGYPEMWDGRDNSGKALPDGTYHYNIVNRGEVLHKGFVTILR